MESRASGDGRSVAALFPQLRSRLRCCREAAPARRAEPMLDLEVVPERSLGNEQWEFTLGECGILPQNLTLLLTYLQAFPASGLCPLFPCARGSSPLPSSRLFGLQALSYPFLPARLASLSLVLTLTPSPHASAGLLLGQWYSSNNNNNG